MATLVLSAAGAALGSGIGGTILGLSGAVIGRAAGATIGRAIDQRLLGQGSDAVEVGRLDRLRLTGASEGSAIPTLWGRMRIGGQVIWASRFQEQAIRRRGGKGGTPSTTEYSYSISLAIGLGKGEILRVGRIWADGTEIAPKSLNLRVYTGTDDQLPDAKIEAVEGSENAPAFRGLAYVIIEDLDLSRFGNRVPQFTFEVMRPANNPNSDDFSRYDQIIRGVALIPGTGEYALATTPVSLTLGPGRTKTLNVNSPSEDTDFTTSLQQLTEELPNCRAVSLVVSWFGDDLRCGQCSIKPKVEQNIIDPEMMPWRAGGIDRAAAEEIRQVDGRPIYGGTPSDASVIEAIAALRAKGREVMFYPFILMEQSKDNTLPDPWTGEVGQPALPWRGRITTSLAPGIPGTPDRTALAATEVDDFFGAAESHHFTVIGGEVHYSGPTDWGLRRFILHYAHLCALAGGVDAFCIGSELRGITRIRGAGDSFPAVSKLKTLAAEVKSILGNSCKVSYASDWTEYGSYFADGNLYFPLDDLWADPSVDFVGIDNYLPISDWRSDDVNADEHYGSVYSIDYLCANILGGEGYDWYYDSPEGEARQVRLEISDDAHDEPWVFRVKDIKSWWSFGHHARQDGIRAASPTAWVPQSKPIWFTEYGCPAVDKGTNQPNRFLDPESSESGLPRASSGSRDDLAQLQYYRAQAKFWFCDQNNPVSSVDGRRMVDLSHAFAWAWDARPFPQFPGRSDLWSDGRNYSLGHWLNGKATAQSLTDVLSELSSESGLELLDASSAYGAVKGFLIDRRQSARAAMQPLLVAYAVDSVENGSLVAFKSRLLGPDRDVRPADCVFLKDASEGIEWRCAPFHEVPGIVNVGYLEESGSYENRVVGSGLPNQVGYSASEIDLPLVLAHGEAKAISVRAVAETDLSRGTITFALPPSRLDVKASDRVRLNDEIYRVDRVETGTERLVEATRVDPKIYEIGSVDDLPTPLTPFTPAAQVFSVFLDIPLLSGSEVEHSPYVAISSNPWQGAAAVWSSSDGAEFSLNRLVPLPATIGITQSELSVRRAGVWDEGEGFVVRVSSGDLATQSKFSVLNGANAALIGDGSTGNWEVIQFREVNVVSDGVYEIRGLLRGLAGTDATSNNTWPAGSLIVLMDRSVVQIEMSSSLIGLARTYRTGLAVRGFGDYYAAEDTVSFQGIGLRPYSVCHLKYQGQRGGVIQVTWIRRTRVGGDSWNIVEVPLGESVELYEIRVIFGSTIVARYSSTLPRFEYTPAMQASDGVTAGFSMEIAMVSATFGPGPFRRIDIP